MSCAQPGRLDKVSGAAPYLVAEDASASDPPVRIDDRGARRLDEARLRRDASSTGIDGPEVAGAGHQAQLA